MTSKELLDFISGIDGASCDCPFDGDFETTVFRHTDTKRWFGLYLYAPVKNVKDGITFSLPNGVKEVEVVNFKTPPELSILLRENYKSLLPAYHMNKTHWNTVILGGDVPDCELKNLLKLSFDLTRK